MDEKNFVHLHVHTQFSLLDGISRIKNLIEQTKALGMNAIAITDHGNLYGAVAFYKAARALDVKPIIGCEMYLAPKSRHDHKLIDGEKYYHLILLAENNRGWQNLMKLVSLANTEGFYHKPRVDKELLRQYHEGLIALSACIAGEIPKAILNDDHERADQLVQEYVDIFGRDNFFLELQDHGLDEEKTVADKLIELAGRHDVRLVVTNDVHYVLREDSKYQDIMICIQTNSTVDDKKRLRYEPEKFYLKSPEEMRALFLSRPDAADNTVSIAARCNVTFEFDRMRLPHYPIPKKFSNAADYLRALCFERLPKLYPKVDDKISARLEHELSTIRSMGFDNYFLIVRDFIQYAKSQGIAVGPGRGSAAGSIVAYLLGITNLDPLKLGLLFERFLNPERVTMPDIDVDFCYLRREEVIEYVKRTYGKERVGQIVTFGTMAAKAAVRDVGRALGFKSKETGRIVQMMPNEIKFTLEEALETSNELRQEYEKDARVKELIDISKQLEGLSRHTSVHAAGLVIAPEPLNELVPVQKTGETLITQFDKDTLEELGLLKIDFLGLRTLTALSEALANIKKHYAPFNLEPIASKKKRRRDDQLTLFDSPLPTVETIPLSDRKTAEMLAEGRTGAVFQLESAGITKLVRDLRPKCFDDLIPIVALYRPGPLGSGMVQDFIDRKNGKVSVEYLHPSLEPILRETYGVILYQEQVMEIVRELAGFTLGRADLLRRAMSKKKSDILIAQKKAFVDGCSARSIDEALAEKIFELLVHFADYGFNKSHSAAYGLLTWQMAYLKANYPAEYMAAMLSSVMDIDKSTVYADQARQMGLTLLGPDINQSDRNFTVIDGKIRFGLAALWNISEQMVEEVIKKRNAGGAYKSLTDFCRRVDQRLITKRVIEIFVKSGAFDSLEPRREELFASIDDALASQVGLFEEHSAAPTVKGETSSTILQWEKETLGFYLTGHPLDEFRDKFKGLITIREIKEKTFDEKKRLRIPGLIIELRRSITKNGDTMCFVTLEDFTDRINVTVFPKVYQDAGKRLELDKAVIMDCSLETYNGEQTFTAEAVMSASEYEPNYYLTVADDDQFEQAKKICAEHPGKRKLFINRNGEWKFFRGFSINDSPTLREALERLLGADNVRRI